MTDIDMLQQCLMAIVERIASKEDATAEEIKAVAAVAPVILTINGYCI